MITVDDLHRIIDLLGEEAERDIAWAEALTEPPHAEEFAAETIYVICNSGMRFKTARKIYDRVMGALHVSQDPGEVFHHEGKVAAIRHIWQNRDLLFKAFLESPDRTTFLGELPWIGSITKWHLAKNFGADVAKPDIHLQRLADRDGTTPQALCARLAAATGYRIATVDTLLWRACATGVLNSRTGTISEAS